MDPLAANGQRVTSQRRIKYSDSRLNLIPAFTALADDWRCGDLYPDTAARQFRVLTGFHDAFVICRPRCAAVASKLQVKKETRPQNPETR